jgi:hypothetical protein
MSELLATAARHSHGDFDWHGDKDRDAILLTYQPPVAVYRTRAGEIVIRQKADETEEYDAQIFLTPQGALAVAWALMEDAHLAGLPEPSLQLFADSPHWPPANRRPAPQAEPAPDGETEEDGGNP